MNKDMKLEALAAMMGGKGSSHMATCPKCGYKFEMKNEPEEGEYEEE